MRLLAIIFYLFTVLTGNAASLLIPMDRIQKNHLKAYGITYYALEQDMTVDWLLNYRGGSFLMDYNNQIETECIVRGVTCEVISAAQANEILQYIAGPSVNMNVAYMGKAPRIAVYSPRNDQITDETDAVLAVLDYAEIPYTIIYDPEVLNNELALFDWLHLHHEDFTGQVDRFNWRGSSRMESLLQIKNAEMLGYASVPEMKMAVVRKIRDFVAGGGYLFAMCSGAETFDLTLSAEGLAVNPFAKGNLNPPLDYDRTLAFRNFHLEGSDSRRFSDINTGRGFNQLGYFTLFDFSAKWDLIPTILTQDHERIIREFFGLTTAFNGKLVKPTALVLGENRATGNVRYIYGELGKGHWSYYSGHDPERSNMRGRGRGPTDLDLFPNSPGYRLILNNVLFPSAKKKKQKT